RAQLHALGLTREHGERRQRLQERERAPGAQEHVVPGPERVIAELLRAAPIGDDRVEVGHPRGGGEVLDGQSEAQPRHLASALISTVRPWSMCLCIRSSTRSGSPFLSASRVWRCSSKKRRGTSVL